MGMGALELAGSAKILVVILVLAGASIMDIRFRRIPDRFWALMMAAGLPLLAWEMWLKGGDESPITMLSLLLPAAGFLFIIFGYPEPKEILKGSLQDIGFASLYLISIVLGVLAFVKGDGGILSGIGISMIFMAIYFVLYTVPIGGARLIHGGADAKCLIALAALFPWYPPILPFQAGPFYTVLADIPSIGVLIPEHLSILFNGAVISAVVALLMIPLINIIKGNVKGLRPTSYMMDIQEVEGKFVWIVMDNKEKKDPRHRLIKAMKKNGKTRVRVTPKIPFILYLFLGALVQFTIGNLVLALILI